MRITGQSGLDVHAIASRSTRRAELHAARESIIEGVGISLQRRAAIERAGRRALAAALAGDAEPAEPPIVHVKVPSIAGIGS